MASIFDHPNSRPHNGAYVLGAARLGLLGLRPVAFVSEELVSRLRDGLSTRETGCLVHPRHRRQDCMGGTGVLM